MELGLYNELGTLVPFHVARESLLCIGKPATGKSSLLVRLALDDIYNGLPVIFFDPHGESVDEILRHIPKNRQKDVVLFNPALFPFQFNLLADVPEQVQPLFTTTILDTIKSVWGYEDAPTPTLDQYIRGGIQTLLKVKGTSLVSLKFLLTDKDYRTEILGQLKDNILKDFWDDFDEMTLKEKRQETASTLNKVRAFMFEPRVRDCIDASHNRLSFKDKIVLVSLRESDMGAENASLLGALILCQLYIEGVQGLNTTLYIDGHQFGTSIIGRLLTGCKNITTVLAVQYLNQLTTPETILGSVEHMLSFRIGIKDAKTLDPEFMLNPGNTKLYELTPYMAYFTDGRKTDMLSMTEHSYEPTHQEDKILRRCISQYAAPRRIDRFFRGK